MCGIIGYIGKNKAKEIVFTGLKKLEYRGYDSWGILIYKDGEVFLKKRVGKINKTDLDNLSEGNLSVGHTRWATHGGVTEYNAHPHFDCRRKIFVVHNGIIENYENLKNELIKKGHKFNSETDTEVFPHLIEEFLRLGLSYEESIFRALSKIIGSFAFVIFNSDFPNWLVGIRFASPLVLGKNKDEVILASDPIPVSMITNEFLALEDGEIVFIKNGEIELKNFKNESKNINFHKIDWEIEDTEMGSFEDFMLKEIYEIPKAIRNTLRGRVIKEKGDVKLGGIETVEKRLEKIEKFVITACGTAFYAGLVGNYLFEDLANVSVESVLASELRYRNYPFDEKTCLIAVSQSGETIDTLEAVKEAKKRGALTLGIINVPGSTIARTVDAGIYTYAGPEIAVASTKAYYSQIVALFLLSIFIGRKRTLSFSESKNLIEEILNISEKAEEVLNDTEKIKKLANYLKNKKSMFYLGRRYSFPVALEGALKMKEIAYIHAEGYAGGEMKHGPLALVEEDYPCVFVIPKDSIFQKSMSNVEELKARGGKLILISDEDLNEEFLIKVAKTIEYFTPLITTIPLHLLAYFTAKLLGKNIDRPRNLAKSVTVE